MARSGMARHVAPTIVPLVHVKQGHVVHPARRKWLPVAEHEAALDQVADLFKQHDAVYVLDQDGQFSGVANLEFLQQLERKRVHPWVDAGPRTSEDAMDLLFAGVETLTLRPQHMGPEKIHDVAELSDVPLHAGIELATERSQWPTIAAITDLVQRSGVHGIVLIEEAQTPWRDAENLAHELKRTGLEVTWVARHDSPHTGHAQRSDRFARVIVPHGWS